MWLGYMTTVGFLTLNLGVRLSHIISSGHHHSPTTEADLQRNMCPG